MFRLTLLVLAIIGLTAAAQNSPGDAAKKEWAKLEGQWKAAAGEIHGKKLPEEIFKLMEITFTGDSKYLVQVEGKTVVEATIKIDPAKTPRTMDMIFTKGGAGAGNSSLGIYELKGDALKLCFGDPGKQRPTEFSSAQNTLIEYQRVKAK